MGGILCKNILSNFKSRLSFGLYALRDLWEFNSSDLFSIFTVINSSLLWFFVKSKVARLSLRWECCVRNGLTYLSVSLRIEIGATSVDFYVESRKRKLLHWDYIPEVSLLGPVIKSYLSCSVILSGWSRNRVIFIKEFRNFTRLNFSWADLDFS